jgi:hypothetical protein
MMVSTDTISSVSGGKVSTAASSPIPSITPDSPARPLERRAKKRSISSNSP